MKPAFLAALEKYAATLTEDDTVYVGALPVVRKETSRQLIQKGWWHTLFIAEDSYAQYGLRIIPDKPWQEWPLVANIGKYACFTIGPEARLYLPFIVYESVLKVRSLRESFNEEWDVFLTKGGPIHQIMEGPVDALDRLHTFLGDKKNMDAKLKKEDLYSNFFEAFDRQGLFDEMKKIVTDLIKKKAYLPDAGSADLGIFESKIMNMAGTKIYLDTKAKATMTAAKLLLRAFETPSCYDPCDAKFSLMPDTGTEGSAPAVRIAEALSRPAFAEQDLVAAHVLFPAAQALMEKGVEGYIGVEHLEAAALLDDKLKRPQAAWNALVGAAYWSGRNLGKTMEPALDAALHLCEKHKWNDAATALSYQRSFF